MIAGSDMKFDFISLDIKEELEGYKLLLDGKLTFNFQKLSKWMQSKRMTSNNYDAQLAHDEIVPSSGLNSYYWEIYYFDGNDGMLVTKVNAMTGEHSSIRPITRMGD